MSRKNPKKILYLIDTYNDDQYRKKKNISKSIPSNIFNKNRYSVKQVKTPSIHVNEIKIYSNNSIKMESKYTIRAGEKTYTIFGSEEDLMFAKSLGIKDCRFYKAGLIDKETKEKKLAITIPLGEIDNFVKLTSSEGISIPVVNKKPAPKKDLEDEEEEISSSDKTTQEWAEAFTIPEKKPPKRYEDIKLLKTFSSNGTFSLMKIFDVANLRFQIYFSPMKTLVFFQNYVAVIQFTDEFYEHESVYKRDLKCTSREEFMQKYIVMLRNYDCQPYSYSQTDLGEEKVIYFYINKYQKDVKKKFISQFLKGIDLYLFETNFLLSLQP